MFCQSIVDNIGKYYFQIEGNLSAIVFTAGIGENAIDLRKDIINKISKVTGIELDEKSNQEIASFKEDPKAYQNQVVEKASDYKDLAVDTFQDYKTKFENGDITADDLTKAVQEKTAQVADFAKESFELIKEKTAQVTPEQADVEAETKAIVDDIVIDIKDISEEAAEAK